MRRAHPHMVWAETPPRARGRLQKAAEVQGEMAGASAYAGKTSSLSLSIPLTVLVFSGILLLATTRESCLRTVRLGFPQTVVFFFIGIRCSALANCSRVIPRACEENTRIASTLRGSGGSPPRVRGKTCGKPLRHRCFRITPAHAGKTHYLCQRGAQGEDHPRACGENSLPPQDVQRSRGSPPRVRGKPNPLNESTCQVGITPARAGKTDTKNDSFHFWQDHPRACGENSLSVFPHDVAAGSPPRVRGKPNPPPAAVRGAGITPARAGKTTRSFQYCPSPADHPRACGENRSTRS